MKKFTLLFAVVLSANIVIGQINKIDTSFYSESLQEIKMVDVYFPPGYDENPDMYYPVIYYLHAWLADQNLMGSEMLAITQSMINNGSISPVIMVCADNSPDPFGGTMYTNSILWGNYEDYMITDLINWIENSFRAVPSKNYRALLGHSMGGYGAFRYGTLHKNKFRVLAATASAMVNLTDQYLEYSRQKIMTQNIGPPFTYDYYTTDFSTKGLFLFCGAFSPNLNSPQTYINPQIVEFAMDSNGNWIDTIVDKMKNNSIDHLIHQLSPEDSVGILFGCGSADVSIYPCHIAFKDTLDLLGLPYEFYDHTGGHIMPSGFKQRALIFIDSLMMDTITPSSTCLPGGIIFTSQEQIYNFQNNYPFCKEIEGDVNIHGEDITNLDGLNPITSIFGNLTIGGIDFINCNNLSDLSGLCNLTNIGGSLAIGNCHSLINLSGLDSLASVGGDLSVGMEGMASSGGNDLITSLTGLESLNTIGGDLIVFNNSVLTNINALENIGTVTIESLKILGNNALSYCHITNVCDYLVSPNATIDISNNAPGCNSLEEVDSLCNITGIAERNFEYAITILPNPVKDQAYLNMNNPLTSTVEMCIYNTTGICLKSWQFQNQQPGQKEFTLDLKNLQAGIYFCRVQIGNEVVTKKIIKIN